MRKVVKDYYCCDRIKHTTYSGSLFNNIVNMLMKFRCLLMVTPKYLASFCQEISCPLKWILQILLWLIRPKMAATVLDSFILIRQVWNQLAASLIYLWSWIAAMLAFSLHEKNMVSSAKGATFVLSDTGMSLVQILYRAGERRDPCGTPAVM